MSTCSASLLDGSKAILSKVAPSLAEEYSREYRGKDTPSEVSSYWENKLYDLEERTGQFDQLHHRLYLKESANESTFWLRYFEKEVVPALMNS